MSDGRMAKDQQRTRVSKWVQTIIIIIITIMDTSNGATPKGYGARSATATTTTSSSSSNKGSRVPESTQWNDAISLHNNICFGGIV